jgi:pyruvate kinase
MAIDRLLEQTLAALRNHRDRALQFESSHAPEVEAVERHFRNSARNLLHYLSLRQSDLRRLQRDLHSLGLSSLGNLESHTLASLNAVIANLEALTGETATGQPRPPVDFLTGPLLLRDHAKRLLGPARRNRLVRIMVTMPSEAATNERLVEDLVRAGMDVMRINCAHDGPAAWRNMAANLRRARRLVGHHCLIQADLAGPKLRTGSIAPLGNFIRIRPRRDPMGRIEVPARVWLTPAESPEQAPAGATMLPLHVPGQLTLQPEDVLHLTDLRGRERELRIVACEGRSAVAETDRTIYVATGDRLGLMRTDSLVGECIVGDLPGVVVPIPLLVGDTLLLTRDPAPGTPASRDVSGTVSRPARIHCTLPAAFERVRSGDRIWLDDGKIGGSVWSSDGEHIEVEVTHAPATGGKLRAEKGINFPDTDLGLAALTDKDLGDLREVVDFADIVALSFLRTPQDIVLLEDHLQALGAGHLGIVLKIENAAAFRSLPHILLTSLRSPPVGVMLARGDLAVEVGFERLSEVQEEILWLCEAAHVPVIWATQVLEGLAKGGAPSRAEISDVVMSSRAECVMLNKGPHVVSTVEFLADILERMEEHYDKRMALRRRLSVSDI